ncbi:hypothetical protein Ate01nite_72740 [Actinoplanes teichomyceticus]|uniref:hypothetical protein n=1 Tax=Actinoplanes teichomyceticus TaxID=1867 RepID=UPI0011EB7F22|nr:hypothetical protein [Actinoplanes teichomyceticus]GIF17242.1 hypothetical protein Ate01nite_72740 [Actinoplanes teichomyceticus]
MTLAAVTATSGVLASEVTPAWAVTSPAHASYASAASFDPAAADRLYVNYLALYDPRSLVRTAAWSALIATNVNAAVARFLNSELAYAVNRSDELNARNADFARRILATHTAEFAPEVHAAAKFALNSGPTALDAFARTGYAAAMQRDRAAREAAGAQAAALVQADRDFVAALRDTDPGAQVRAAAGYALRAEATDADVVEFFAYDWAAAASADMQAQQVQCANSDMVWLAAVKRLQAEAEAAEKAALAAVGEAQIQARAAAARAWHAMGEQASSAQTTWEAAEKVAAGQAANWQQIARAAADATDNPNWQPIADTAPTTAQQWTTWRNNAASRTAYWAGLYELALQGERKMQP